MMNKKIYLEPVWKVRIYNEELISYPPEGYEFIKPQTASESFFKFLSKTSFSYLALVILSEIMPVYLIKSYLEKCKKIPKGIDLTYSCDHLIFRKEPYVIELEHVASPLGMSKHLKTYMKIIEKALASNHCKRIFCWLEAGKKTVLLNLDCTKFKDKIEVVPPATHKKDFTKYFNNDKVKLLFVGTANVSGLFETKGGPIVLEAFFNLNRKYDNLELVIRSDIPKKMKDECRRFNNIRVIDKIISWVQLENEFKTADIFVMPAPNTPVNVLLNAMSYELPVVTIDTLGNSEIVEDGNTGFTVEKSERLQYYTETFLPNWDTPQFRKAIKTLDPKVVEGLVEKLSILIENPELRRRMGKAGRYEIEEGKFSIAERNKKLKKIFDEAILGEEESD
jgi:glycosyltransferase involved in cell wall biosynthesis